MSFYDGRNQHDRFDSHFGTMSASLVELSSALGFQPAGATLTAIVLEIHERLVVLEEGVARRRVSSFSVDTVVRVPTSAYIDADAVIV